MRKKKLEKETISEFDKSEEIEDDEEGKSSELFFGEKRFRTALGILSILFIFLFSVDLSVMSQETGVEEIKNRVSEVMAAGFTLDAEITVELDARDFEVTGFDGYGTARMLIWDFKGDTNNEIQILVDGQVIREVHVLNSNVAAYSVPVPGLVTIRGLSSDAGAPITYAVKFPDRKQTLFNVVPTNGTNTYKLVPRF